MTILRIVVFVVAGVLAMSVAAGDAQSRPKASQAPPTGTPPSKVATSPGQLALGQISPPADYVIGTDDVLIVVFRREKDMSAEVVVRPDGKITLPVLNDIQAAGLTPDQLRVNLTEEAKRLVEDPNVTVAVKQINSRKVFITGQVRAPGAYPIGARMTIVQLIAMAGGLTEYAKQKDIVIIRDVPAGMAKPGAKPITFRFNYEDVQKLKNLASNLDLKPGDTVIVP
jgi:polysaccharide export outer membrane protein